MRLLPLLLPLFLLAGCGSEDSADEAPPPATRAEAAADNRVDCAIGSTVFERRCTVEQVPDEAGLALVLRAPNGSFRRLRVTDDGRGVIAADGSQPAQVTPLNDALIEVSVAGDRYRLPATVRPAER